MDNKQTHFVNFVKSMTTAENKPVMESVLKAYVITEGNMLPSVKNFARAAKVNTKRVGRQAYRKLSNTYGRIMHDPTKLPEVPRELAKPTDTTRDAVLSDNVSLHRDLPKFQEACNTLLILIKSYGNKVFNLFQNSPTFQSAIKDGEQLDRAREELGQNYDFQNMMVKQMQFVSFLESIAAKVNPALIDSIYKGYFVTEANYGVDTRFLFETTAEDFEYEDDDTRASDEKRRRAMGEEEIRNAMCVVCNFIRHHGLTAWNYFKNSPQFKAVYSNSAKYNA